MHAIECIVFHNLCIDSLNMHTIKLHSLIFHINSGDIASTFWLITSLIFNGSKHTEQCIVCCVSCRDCRYKRSKHVMLQWFKCYVMSIQSIQNAYTCTHVSAHNFLNIQRIFNPKKVLECWESGLSNHTIKSYMSIVSTVSTLPVHY